MLQNYQHFIFFPDLFQAWVKFVNIQDWKPSSYFVIFEKHFTEDAFIRGFRNLLDLEANPIPRIHPTEAPISDHQSCPIFPQIRKPPKIRNVEHDQLNDSTSRAGQYLNTLCLNTVFKYIHYIYILYLNTFFNLYLITVFKYF